MRYQLNSRRINLEEYRLGTAPLVAEFSWLVSRLPIRFPGSSDVLPVDELNSTRVEKEIVDQQDLVRFQPLKEQIKGVGFTGTIYHFLDDRQHQAKHTHASYLHQSGNAIARIRFRDCRASSKKLLVVEYLTLLADGRLIVTSGGKCDLLSPEEVDDQFHGDASPDELWSLHQDRIKSALASENVVTINNGKQLLLALEQHHKLCRDDLVDRGVFEPIESTEPIEGEVISNDNDSVLAAVRKQESKSQSWISTAMILVVSMGLFFGAGLAAWSLETTLLIIGVLLVHELGHYVAMRAFDYRNLKMFFIPFLGAAVSGRNYNVAGWKRVVVSLMGPIPGIAIGVIVGIYGTVHGHEFSLNLAVMLIVLNGFNLLPSLPLDGGWVMHCLLYSRHPYLDLASRVLAAIAMLLLSAVFQGPFLMVIGMSMLFGLPHIYRTIKIADNLRGKPELKGMNDDARIPDAAVSLINSQIDELAKQPITTNVKATMVVQIYELINTRPPGLLASVILGVVYLGSVVAALIAGVIFAMAQHTDLGQLMMDAAMGPQTIIDPQEVMIESNPNDVESLVAPECVIATYLDRAEALAGFESVSNESGDQPTLLFGNQVLVPIQGKNERSRWLDVLESDAESIFVDWKDTPATFRLHCVAPTEAKAEALAAAFSGIVDLEPYALDPLVPAWEPGSPLTPTQLRARITFGLAARARHPVKEMDDSEFELIEQIQDALSEGNDDKVKQLTPQQTEKDRQRQAAGIAELRENRDSELDLELLEEYKQWMNWMAEQPAEDLYRNEEDRATDRFLRAPSSLESIARRMGQTKASSYVATSAHANNNGLILTIEDVDFEAPAAGCVALLRWLESEGCAQFKADFVTF